VTDRPGVREKKLADTRERIVVSALELFSEFGYTPTSIDRIAERAGIGRSTFFRYFPTKEAVLFSDLLVRQRMALELLRQRPLDELPLVSLLAVFSELCDQPIDNVRRRHVREIVRESPDLVGMERRLTVYELEEALVQIFLERGTDHAITEAELRVLISTAIACLESAWRAQMTNGRTSLAVHFSSMVETCAAHWGAVNEQLGD
jgi:AcrR family transcriptional regulator